MMSLFASKQRAGEVPGPEVEADLSFWAVHIYRSGEYLRTLQTPMEKGGAEVFCLTFNNAGKDDLKAIALECKIKVKAPARIENPPQL